MQLLTNICVLAFHQSHLGVVSVKFDPCYLKEVAKLLVLDDTDQSLKKSAKKLKTSNIHPNTVPVVPRRSSRSRIPTKEPLPMSVKLTTTKPRKKQKWPGWEPVDDSDGADRDSVKDD
ncbi:hypothetical protein B0H10DRAFT_2228912 [Mycena sp. CBHHK59/15]|nr:hypothetical protein B0H10DRAFT_2243017 [Mycena sp. CBHHK59/15]KAJ6605762.1 hypothetical protein B0H10DRAFT_2228912 [Mycena sp. CBHHK59/15]